MNFFIRIFICILSLYASLVQGVLPSSPANSSHKLKQDLALLYQDHRSTFFCEQPFTAKNNIIFQSCKECPLINTQVDWMPLVPYSALAGHLLCYREKLCVNQQGQRFKGLRCCQKINETYRLMSRDLHNFVPELKILKQYRRQYSFGLIADHPSSQQGCHFYIDKKSKIIEIAPHLRGKVARTYLYMKDTYHMPLNQEQFALYYDWHQQYPADAWEKERNEKIKAIQGNGNPYIQ